MARWAPQRRDVLEQLVDELLHNYGRSRAIIAIDGVDPASTAAFSADVAEELTRRGHAVFRAALSGFHRSRADRESRGSDSAQTAYRDGFDFSVFRRILVEPFRMGEGAAFVLAAFDVERDRPIPAKWRSGPHDAILLVDGTYLGRSELRGLWNTWIRLEDTAAVADDAEKLYTAEVDPRTEATIVIDITDPEHPRRRFADSC